MGEDLWCLVRYLFVRHKRWSTHVGRIHPTDNSVSRSRFVVPHEEAITRSCRKARWCSSRECGSDQPRRLVTLRTRREKRHPFHTTAVPIRSRPRYMIKFIITNRRHGIMWSVFRYLKSGHFSIPDGNGMLDMHHYIVVSCQTVEIEVMNTRLASYISSF